MQLHKASQQWATRPDDERFMNLLDMLSHFRDVRDQSVSIVAPSRHIHALPTEDNKGLQIMGKNGNAYEPTHWSFGQLAQLAEAPARYLRTLPSPIAADCINYGMHFKRNIEDVGFLLQRNGQNTLRAATGPRYGRIWNEEIVNALVERFGDGITGDWRVPGEFGKHVDVNKRNTTLYAGDRDMFVFLADEEHRIEIPNRRNGESGTLARGFFVVNSEVGASTFSVSTFLFDYVCANRIVWGAQDYREIKMRHTVSAPDRFLDEIRPALDSYANSSSKSITESIETARAAKLDKVDEFLANRFGARAAVSMQQIHLIEEGRPVENRWDAITAATAFARSIHWQDDRVAIERKAGEIL